MKTGIIISSKGQVVIPKDVREALRLEPGTVLQLHREGHRIVLEAPQHGARRERISYEEFRRRVPRYQGPQVAVEDMTADIGKLFEDWDG